MPELTVTVGSALSFPDPLADAHPHRLLVRFVEKLDTSLTHVNPAHANAQRRGRADPSKERIKLLVRRDGLCEVPRGCLPELRAAAKPCGVTLTWDPAVVVNTGRPRTIREVESMAGVGGRAFAFRPEYQPAIVAAILDRRQGVVVLPCGGGKTTSGVGAILVSGEAALVLVHTEDLLDQWVETIRRMAGVDPRVVGAGHHDPRPLHPGEVAVGMVQSLQPHLDRYGPLLRSVGFLLVDECFPAGTMVGCRQIESLQVGDLVPSWDEATGEYCERVVTAVMRSRPSAMVLVTFEDGTFQACTPGHPFLTEDGWNVAGALKHGEAVIWYENEDDSDELHRVRGTAHADHQTQARVVSTDRPSLLQQDVFRSVHREDLGSNDSCNEPKVGVCANEDEQPDVAAGSSCEDGCVADCDWTSADHSRRERDRYDAGAETTCSGAQGGTFRMGDGVRRCARGREATVPLQDGHRTCDDEGLRGGGRRVALHAGPPGCRPSAGRTPRSLRVDHVAVLERGSDGRYGGVCADGYVYNIEVEGTHTYLVGRGLIVHNCHRSPCDLFRQVVNACPGRFRIGLSATPNRADGFGFLINALIGPVIYKLPRGAVDLIEWGYLRRPLVVPVASGYSPPDSAREWVVSCPECATGRRAKRAVQTLGTMDDKRAFSNGLLACKRAGRASIRCDYIFSGAEKRDLGQLVLSQVQSDAAVDPARVSVMSALVQEGASVGRLSLTLVNRKDGVEALVVDHRARGIRVRGVTSEVDDRGAIIAGFRARKYESMVATQLADEGLDVPALDLMVMGSAGRHDGTAQQRVGRTCRPTGHEVPVVFDIVDDYPAARSQWRERATAYVDAYGAGCLPTDRPVPLGWAIRVLHGLDATDGLVAVSSGLRTFRPTK